MSALKHFFSRLMRVPILRLGVFAAAALGAVMLYLLSQASANTPLFSQQYPLLLIGGVTLALALIVLVAYQLWVLRRKLKAGVFGARLAARMLIVFSLMALVPGLILYAVSVRFLAQSIESWFNVQVDTALKDGVKLSRAALDAPLKELARKADAMAAAMAERPAGQEVKALFELREQYGVYEALLVNSRGRLIALAGQQTGTLLPELPGQETLRQIRQQRSFSKIEAVGEQDLYLRVVVPVNSLGLTDDIRALQVLEPVPGELSRIIESVSAGDRNYQEVVLARQGLSRLFGLTLSLSLLLTLLSAIALAVLISERMAAPLAVLADSTRAIAKGDFTKFNPVQTSDEFGVLTQSFNIMTRQLAEASDTVSRNQQQLAGAKSYLETILGNLSSGVIAFDEQGQVRTVNASVPEILGVDLETLRGVRLAEWGNRAPTLAPFANSVQHMFQAISADEQIAHTTRGMMRTLHLRSTRLPLGADRGHVLVIDDITELMQAQRESAWGEVARRLAHEIKNPLTPIQLSAERLEAKLADKLPPAEAQMLTRSTQTIVKQVAALKGMVDDFSAYARASEMRPAPVRLNELVREVLVLYESMDAKIRFEPDENLSPVQGDARMLAQVLHNLLQNSLDALAGSADGEIVIRTEALPELVRLTVADNGGGFADQVLARACEPYVTTKPKGTGLGLAIVKRIIDEHDGRIQVANAQPHGASVSITLPLAKAA